MRQIAYHTAVGCSCFVGGSFSSALAAEWSATPNYSSSVDYDSNRLLQSATQGSESTVLTADLRLKRALDNSDIYLDPHYTLRRYSNARLGNGDDRSVGAGFDWNDERGLLNLTGSLGQQSTLQSEVFETGIISANTDRRLLQTSGNWTWSWTERRQLVSQISYSDVTYHGSATSLLPGYRYTSANIGERYLFSERGSFTISAYGSTLTSFASEQGPNNAGLGTSREYGVQGEAIYSFTERTRIDASLGESRRRLFGSSGYGTDAAITLTRDLSPGSISLSYTRSLVPQGTGFLVERQQYTANLSRSLSAYVDGIVSVNHVTNNRTAVLLHLERHSYDTVSGTLLWRATETFAVSAQVLGVQTQDFVQDSRTVKDWHGSFMLTWTPHGRSDSW